MSNKNIKKFFIFIFLSAPLFSQDLDEEYLNSLPDDVRKDVLERIDSKNDSEKPTYRKASSLIDRDNDDLDRFDNNTKLFGYDFFDTDHW